MIERQEGVQSSVVKATRAVDEDFVIMVPMENAKTPQSHAKATIVAQKSVSYNPLYLNTLLIFE